MINTNVVKNTDDKNTLIKKINILKNDIEIISKLNKTGGDGGNGENRNMEVSKEERKKNIQLKQNKMTELKKLNEQLKQIHKNTRLEIQKKNNLILTHKAIDTLQFMAAKKKKNNKNLKYIQ